MRSPYEEPQPCDASCTVGVQRSSVRQQQMRLVAGFVLVDEISDCSAVWVSADDELPLAGVAGVILQVTAVFIHNKDGKRPAVSARDSDSLSRLDPLSLFLGLDREVSFMPTASALRGGADDNGEERGNKSQSEVFDGV